MVSSFFRCRSTRCPGTHAAPTHVCRSVSAGGTGVFLCARIHPPCPTHARATHVCRETGDPHAWSCGRVVPPCPGHRTRRPNDRCGAGTWNCTRASPPCVGHRRPGLSCDGDAAREPTVDSRTLGDRGLSVGVNLPWSFTSCGYDFGVAPTTWRARHPSPRRWDDELGTTLDAIAELGLEVVRFWVLADGVAYPERESIAKWTTRRSDPKGLALSLRADAPDPPVLTDAFVEDVRRLLDALHARGLRAIPSFTSFEAFAAGYETKDGTLKQGRGSLFLGNGSHGDAAWIERVLAATLGRLVAIAGPNGERAHPAVLAWEVTNEPEWIVRRGDASAEAISLFLEKGVETIVRAGHVASIGFVDSTARWITPSLASRLHALADEGRYLHQLHYYPKPFGLGCPEAAATDFPGATIVGELALSDAPSARWGDHAVRETERDPARYLVGRLECLEALGYRLALLWSLHASDDKSGWDDEAKRQIRAFTSRRSRGSQGVA